MTTPRTSFHVGHAVETQLRKAALTHGASDAELAAIDRLVDFNGRLVDVERLEPLAKLAGLPWAELFPEVNAVAAVHPIPGSAFAPLVELLHAVQHRRGCPITDSNSHTGSFIMGYLAGTVVRCAEAAVDAGVPPEAVQQIVRNAS